MCTSKTQRTQQAELNIQHLRQIAYGNGMYFSNDEKLNDIIWYQDPLGLSNKPSVKKKRSLRQTQYQTLSQIPTAEVQHPMNKDASSGVTSVAK